MNLEETQEKIADAIQPYKDQIYSCTITNEPHNLGTDFLEVKRSYQYWATLEIYLERSIVDKVLKIVQKDGFPDATVTEIDTLGRAKIEGTKPTSKIIDELDQNLVEAEEAEQESITYPVVYKGIYHGRYLVIKDCHNFGHHWFDGYVELFPDDDLYRQDGNSEEAEQALGSVAMAEINYLDNLEGIDGIFVGYDTLHPWLADKTQGEVLANLKQIANKLDDRASERINDSEN